MTEEKKCKCPRHPLKPASKRIRADDCPIHGDEGGPSIRRHQLRRPTTEERER